MANELTKAVMANLSFCRNYSPCKENNSFHHKKLQESDSKLLANVIQNGTSAKEIWDRPKKQEYKEQEFFGTEITLDELAGLSR